MTCFTAIVDGPLSREREEITLAPILGVLDDTRPRGEVGALLRFEGIVRGLEDGRALRALEYQTYEPMASRQLASLANEIAASHTLHMLVALHSRGEVAAGECSFMLMVGAAHRGPALAAMQEFIDRMKRDVPIWKVPRW